MRAKKSLGQNFLRDSVVIDRIVASLNPVPGETVIEIGPGRGALTEQLLKTGAHVVAIEIDRELVPVLRTQFHFEANFRVVEDDILQCEIPGLLKSENKAPVKIVGNLPYNISTPIIQRLIEQRAIAKQIVVMLQREVVSRLTAEPGDSERGFITVLAEEAFAMRRLFDVPPQAFVPVPKVWSSVMELVPKMDETTNYATFRRLLSLGFQQKRKTILNNLRGNFIDAAKMLDDVQIDPTRRAETLELAEWKKLAGRVAQRDGASGE